MTTPSNETPIKNYAALQDGPMADRYLNRELSWLDFNRRVLHQAIRPSDNIPHWERLRFLSISASNLDEFIAVRLSSILNRVMDPSAKREISGLTPEEEYKRVFPEIKAFKELQEETYHELARAITKAGFRLTDMSALSKKEKLAARRVFMRQIFPLLTPISIDSTKELPFLRSKQLAIAAMVEDPHNANVTVMGIVPISNGLDRIYTIGTGDDIKWLRVEDIITEFLSILFMNKHIQKTMVFRLIREADIELDSNKDIYIVERMLQTLQEREHGRPIFMDYTGTRDKSFVKRIQKLFDILPQHHYQFKRFIDFSLFNDMECPDPKLAYPPFEPPLPEELLGDVNMFTTIHQQDLLYHHPFDAFGPVINFLEQAAEDPDVLVIRQTLYRVSSADSPIVNALCRAAQQGKDVTVLLEIKARFDEERNIGLVDKLQSAGASIVYGMEKLKTHCKFLLVARREGKNIRLYSHIGTGNYNDKTAKVYTDISYFTSNNKLGEDLITVFNVLTGFSAPNEKINKVFYSPFNIRTRLYKLIDREVENVKKGEESHIIFKLNSLSDIGIIHALYEAAEKGVKISIMVRGICSMRPIHPNITITSVVGRFLEHSRLYYFFNKGEGDIYMSSADLLTRNLDRRIEIMVRITEVHARAKLVNILHTYFADTFNTYQMDEQGEFLKVPTGEYPVNVHNEFMNQAELVKPLKKQ